MQTEAKFCIHHLLPTFHRHPKKKRFIHSVAKVYSKIRPTHVATHPKHKKHFNFQKKKHATETAPVIQGRKQIKTKQIWDWVYDEKIMMMIIADKRQDVSNSMHWNHKKEHMNVKEAVN